MFLGLRSCCLVLGLLARKPTINMPRNGMRPQGVQHGRSFSIIIIVPRWEPASVANVPDKPRLDLVAVAYAA
jgi:hypothetical protein